MASKKFDELQTYSVEDLQSELVQTETQYLKLKFDHAVKGLDNPMSLREIRRDIARLKTEIRRREVVAMTPEELDTRSKIRNRRRSKK